MILALGLTAACGDDGNATDDTLDDIGDDTGDVPSDGPTAGVCDPLTQAPCAENERCTWIVTQKDDPTTEAIEANVGRLGCAIAGTIEVGGECTITGPAFPAATNPVDGTGSDIPDQCVKGAWCREFLDGKGICKTICDTANVGTSCSAGFTCRGVNSTFLSMGTIIAGICEPTCNPVTQKTDTDGAEACGSPDPANPFIGCYAGAGADGGVAFACSRIPRDSKGRTHGMTAYGPTDSAGTQTGEFSNGCEAGYVPAYDDADPTVTISDCTGTCAPADSDNSTPALQAAATGDVTALAKLFTESTAQVNRGTCVVGKKGSTQASDCRYTWGVYNVTAATGDVTESPLNDTTGLCFPYSQFTYDHDRDLGEVTAEIGIPSCRDLPAPGVDPTTTIHDTLAWETRCYSWARTQTLLPPEMRTVPRNLGPGRVRIATARPGELARRHILQ